MGSSHCPFTSLPIVAATIVAFMCTGTARGPGDAFRLLSFYPLALDLFLPVLENPPSLA